MRKFVGFLLICVVVFSMAVPSFACTPSMQPPLSDDYYESLDKSLDQANKAGQDAVKNAVIPVPDIGISNNDNTQEVTSAGEIKYESNSWSWMKHYMNYFQRWIPYLKIK